MQKRIIVLGDTHCGHRTGLTPPGSWESSTTETGRLQRQMWHWWSMSMEQQPSGFDACILMGDMIDGAGSRSGGTELITSDRMEQCRIAAGVIKSIPLSDPAKIFLVAGTPYHTGQEEDWEEVLAGMVGAGFSDHQWVDVQGTIFDCKHKIGGSGIPHGRHTAIAKERLWNLLWADRQGAPKSNIIIRGHVHYFNYCGGLDWLGITMPGLQGPGSKFGARQCSGTIDCGFLTFDVGQNGAYTWQPHLLSFEAFSPAVGRV